MSSKDLYPPGLKLIPTGPRADSHRGFLPVPVTRHDSHRPLLPAPRFSSSSHDDTLPDRYHSEARTRDVTQAECYRPSSPPLEGSGDFVRIETEFSDGSEEGEVAGTNPVIVRRRSKDDTESKGVRHFKATDESDEDTEYQNLYRPSRTVSDSLLHRADIGFGRYHSQLMNEISSRLKVYNLPRLSSLPTNHSYTKQGAHCHPSLQVSVEQGVSVLTPAATPLTPTFEIEEEVKTVPAVHSRFILKDQYEKLQNELEQSRISYKGLEDQYAREKRKMEAKLDDVRQSLGGMHTEAMDTLEKNYEVKLACARRESRQEMEEAMAQLKQDKADAIVALHQAVQDTQERMARITHLENINSGQAVRLIEIESRLAQVDLLQVTNNTLSNQIGVFQVQVGRSIAKEQEMQRKIIELESKLANSEAMNEITRNQLKKLQAEKKGNLKLLAQVAEIKQEKSKLEKEKEGFTEALVALDKRLDGERARGDKGVSTIEELEKHIKGVKEELEKERMAMKMLQDDLKIERKGTEEERQQLKKELHMRAAQFREVSERNAVLTEALDKLDPEVASLQKEKEQLQKQLATTSEKLLISKDVSELNAQRVVEMKAEIKAMQAIKEEKEEEVARMKETIASNAAHIGDQEKRWEAHMAKMEGILAAALDEGPPKNLDCSENDRKDGTDEIDKLGREVKEADKNLEIAKRELEEAREELERRRLETQGGAQQPATMVDKSTSTLAVNSTPAPAPAPPSPSPLSALDPRTASTKRSAKVIMESGVRRKRQNAMWAESEAKRRRVMVEADAAREDLFIRLGISSPRLGSAIG